MVVLAPVVAGAFNSPGVRGVLWMLALTFPVLGSTTVQQALLERESRFALLARVESVAALSGLAVGVGSAYLGAGAYSLALQTLTAAVVSSVQLWLASPWRPRWFWSQHEFRGIRKFSDHLVGFNIVNYFSLNADSMIIGRFLGADSLGLYSMAYRLIEFPLYNLTFVATRALYPVMSRQQAVPQEMASLYVRTLTVIAFITAPMMAGLFVLRDLFIVVVLGTKWIGMNDIIVWLAPVGFMTSLTCTTGSVFMARGRTDVLFYLGIFGALVQVTAFFIGMHWGVAGVAAAYFFATLLTIIPDFYFVFRVLEQGLPRFFRAVLKPIALAGTMALIVLLCRATLPIGELPRLVQFVLLILVGVVTYASLAFVFARQSLADVYRLVRRK